MTTVTRHTVQAEEGEHADFPRLGNRYVLRGESSGGSFALVEQTIPPRALAAPMHTHAHEDEYSFVLAGRLGAQIGDDVVEAGPGDLSSSRAASRTPTGTPATRRRSCSRSSPPPASSSTSPTSRPSSRAQTDLTSKRSPRSAHATG